MPIVSTVFRLSTITLTLLSMSLMCAAQEKKIAYGILLDNTGSMRPQFSVVNELGKAIVHQIHDYGPVSLFDFHSEGRRPGTNAVATLRLEASQDEPLLNRAIDNLYVEGGQTTLLDAVEFIEQALNRSMPDTNKIIILITDGEDRTSTTDQKKLIKQLKEKKIAVFAVGLVQQLDDESGLIRLSPSARAIELLKSITKDTGGCVVFPKSDRVQVEKVLTELALPSS